MLGYFSINRIAREPKKAAPIMHEWGQAARFGAGGISVHFALYFAKKFRKRSDAIRFAFGKCTKSPRLHCNTPGPKTCIC